MPIGLESTPTSHNPTIDDDNMTVITTSTTYLPNQDLASNNRYRNTSPRTSFSNFKRFKLTFVLKYEAQPGESVAVVGAHSKLGNMKDFRLCPLRKKLNQTNTWQSYAIEFEKGCKSFMYKYVIIENNQIKQMEKGFNRIAELEILPDTSLVLSQQSTSEQSSKSGRSNNSNKEYKDVVIEDEW